MSVIDGGLGYTHAPLVRFWGGGNNFGNTSWVSIGQPNMPPPNSAGPGVGRVAIAHAVLTTGAISSIVVDDGGAGYAAPPYVEIINSDLDFAGCSAPTATSGIVMATGASPLILNGSCCPTDPISVLSANTADTFVCRWMD